MQRLLNYFFHFLVLNWANVAAFFAIRVVDIKVIVEDLQDVEITVSNVKLAITREPQAPPPSTSFNPDEDVSPQLFASPPMSPSVCSEGVGGQWPSVVPLRSPTARRMESFHRRASSIHTTVSKTASHIWSHAIGSAVDRVTFSLSVSEVAVLLPRSASPVAASNSLPHLSQKSSNGSLNASAPRGFDPISSLLKLRQYSPLGIDEGYEKLLAIENESTLTTCIGFGPNRPILTENNVRADVNVGPLHLSLDGVEKLQALAELRPRAPRRAPPPEFTSKPSIWEPSGLPRVRHLADVNPLTVSDCAALVGEGVHLARQGVCVTPAASGSSLVDGVIRHGVVCGQCPCTGTAVPHLVARLYQRVFERGGYEQSRALAARKALWNKHEPPVPGSRCQGRTPLDGH